VAISDQHGTSDKFDALLVDAIRFVLPNKIVPLNWKLDPDRSLAEQLNTLGLDLLRDIRPRLFFHNLGDFMDRGDWGVRIFRRSVELIKAGLSSFVIGNHDLWAMLGLMGFHLPWYRGYQMYGYRDSYGDVSEFHAQKMDEDPEHVQNPHWWAERLTEFMEYHGKRQKEVWDIYDVLVNGALMDNGKRQQGDGLYAQVSASLKTENQIKLWDRFRGNMFKIEIYTGVRAVGGMSVGWWKTLLEGFKNEYDALQLQPDFYRDSPSALAWQEAIRMMEKEILPEIERDFRDHVEKGQWWWRMFEALNSQNYRSVEWWAKDWLFHKGWASSVIKEVNLKILDLAKKVNTSNYLSNTVMQEIGNFFRDQFTLYMRDIYQNTYMHAFLPVDRSSGEFYFTYKGPRQTMPVEYRGNGQTGFPSIWQGLDQIAADVRDRSHSLSDIYEALSLVNQWYADETTEAKVPNVAWAINHFGIDNLAKINGFDRLITGHLPFHEFYGKLTVEQRGVIGNYIVGEKGIFIDHGMGGKFGGRGLAVYFSLLAGISSRGYPTLETPLEMIMDNPPTARWRDGVFEILFQNSGLTAAVFRRTLLENVKKRLDFISLKYEIFGLFLIPLGFLRVDLSLYVLTGIALLLAGVVVDEIARLPKNSPEGRRALWSPDSHVLESQA